VWFLWPQFGNLIVPLCIFRGPYTFLLITIDGDRGGAFFVVVISEHIYIFYLLPLKFDTRFFPYPLKEIMPSLLMSTMETDRVNGEQYLLSAKDGPQCLKLGHSSLDEYSYS
jgi:hypothetical protein